MNIVKKNSNCGENGFFSKSLIGVGERINLFDNTEQTVYHFNELFPDCPLKYNDNIGVEILDPADNNCRMISVGGELIKHKMFSDLLYTIDRDVYRVDETEVELTEMFGHSV